MAHEWLIYGCYGYTGELIVERCVERGLTPVLAGRNAERVREVAERTGLSYRVFGLDDEAVLDAGIGDAELVLHCAGPYSATSRPMVDACLRVGAHYLDITGEYAVLEAVLGRDAEAEAAGVTLMPAVGFDVIPTDCMAVQLKRALPTATKLELAFSAGVRPSPGTAKTTVEGLSIGAIARRGGDIVTLPKPLVREVPLGGRQRTVMSIPWGDLVTAYASTGIEHITTYTEVPPAVAKAAGLLRYVMPVLELGPVKRMLTKKAGQATGPTAEERKRGRSHIWGRVEDPAGKSVEGSLETMESYELTVLGSLECVRRILEGETSAGATTPATAFGPELITSLPGVGEFTLR